VSTLLVEALRQLNLQPGQSLHVEVDGKDVELRVREAGEASDIADQVMLSWPSLPDPPTEFIVHAKLGPIDPPDPPIIPLELEPS
jgi:hypothetical protein